MRKFVSLLLGIALTLTLGCNRDKDAASGGKQRVALVMKTLNNPFFIDMQRGAQEAADRLGVTLVVQAAEREIDVEKQMQIVENLIQTRIAALCITPSGSKEILPAISKANAAGIPVLVVDTRIDSAAAAEAGAEFATFIGSDNYAGGKLAGEHLAKRLGGSGKIIVLEGIPGHETGDARLQGFRDGVANSAGIEIVASQPANWERDQGFSVAQNLLQAHRAVDAIFACNDMMALGAVEAIAAANPGRPIHIVGFDATDDARTAIAGGRMEASVAQFPSEMGRLAVESAVKLLRGETIPTYVPTKIELVLPEGEVQ